MADEETPDALGDDSAEAPVEEPSPETHSAVDAGTEQATVPAERFNGLMRRFNQEQSERKRLESEINQLRQTPRESPQVSEPNDSDLREEVRQLRTLLIQERIDGARTKAIEDYPFAAPLADLIVGSSPEEIREMAEDIHNRLKPKESTEAPKDEPKAETPAPTPAPAPPVTGGAVPVAGNPATEDKVADALKRRNFRDYFTAKKEAADQAAEIDVVLEKTA